MSYPLLDDFRQRAKRNLMLRPAMPLMESMEETFGDDYRKFAEDVLAVGRDLGWDSVRLLGQSLLEYMKEQAEFKKNRAYGHGSFEEVHEQVYANEKTMLDLYFPGLFLTYFFTVAKVEKYFAFRNGVLPRLAPAATVMDIGYGDGFFLWALLKAGHGGRIDGFDVSPHAVTFCEDLLRKCGLFRDGVNLKTGNVLEGLEAPGDAYDLVVLTDVVEHLPAPEVAVGEAARILKKDGILYLTTPIDSNHMDHLTNFESDAVVDQLLRDGGFTIENKNIYKPASHFPQLRINPVTLIYVCRK